jgi:hypothetical protein
MQMHILKKVKNVIVIIKNQRFRFKIISSI